MNTVIIQTDKKSSKLISELVKKLGGSVWNIDDEKLEDLVLGHLMNEEKTGQSVSRERVMSILQKK